MTAILSAVLILVACSGNGSSKSESAAGILKPYGLTTLTQNLAVSLHWPRINGATAYNLYWSVTPGVTKTNGTKIAAATAPYEHTGLANGTPYYYVYTVETAEGESVESLELSAEPSAVATGAPPEVYVYSSNGEVTVVWVGVAGATSYNVYWKTSRGVTMSDTKISDATSPLVFTGINEDEPRYVVVTAMVNGVESAPSNEVAAAAYTPEPMTPTHVSIAPGDKQVTLNWDAVPGAASYTLYWNTTGSVTTNAQRIDHANAPYTHKKLSNGQRYYYAVVASNARGPSPLSVEVGTQPSKTSIGVPANVSAQSGNEQVTLNWSSVTGADSYNVRWNTGGASQTLTNVVPPYTHMGLLAGVLTYYTVTAVMSGVEGAASAEVIAAPMGATPEAPSYVRVFMGHRQASLVAVDRNDVLRYDVYWNTVGNVTTADSMISDVTLPYVHAEINDGTRLYYKIAAVNRYGAGPLSKEVSALPANDTLEEVVSDPVLQGCIDTAAANYGWSYARQVEYVLCDNIGIAPDVISLAGIEKLGNLSGFHLLNDGATAISDIDSIGAVPNLIDLTLLGTGLSNANVVNDLSNLEYLNVFNNVINDITPLQLLTNLNAAYLGSNQINDVAPLAGLTGLQTLWLDQNNIVDVTALANLTGLTTLNLQANNIIGVSPLASLTALQQLYLANNSIGGSQVGKVDLLKALTQATTITLGDNVSMSCSEAQNLLDNVASGVVDLDNNFTTSGDVLNPGTNCTEP